MNQQNEAALRKKVKTAIAITIAGLLLNGLSAIPVRTEMSILLSNPSILPQFMLDWWTYVNKGLLETTASYPFMRYGLDWLGFAHLLIALAFIGPWRDPVKNQWVVQWGMWASALSVVMALAWEQLRGIPLWWSILDASIGLIAYLVLWFCNKWINDLKAAQQATVASA